MTAHHVSFLSVDSFWVELFFDDECMLFVRSLCKHVNCVNSAQFVSVSHVLCDDEWDGLYVFS